MVCYLPLDNGSENLPCDRGVAREQFGSIDHLDEHKCRIHKASTLHGKTFAFKELDYCVRSMVHVALSVRTGGAMVRFEKALAEEVASRFELLCGQPSSAALEYKRVILSLFCSHGARVQTKRILLISGPNGEWRSDLIQFYVAPSLGLISREAAIAHVVKGLLLAFCSAQFSIYPQNDWTGADIATDELGIFEACHRLLTTTFLRFSASYVGGTFRTSLLQAAVQHAKYDFKPVAVGEVEDGAPADAGNAGAGGIGDSSNASVPDLGKAAEIANAPAQHAKYRRSGSLFCQSNSLASIMLIRFLLEPLRTYMSELLTMSGEEWELRQQARLVESLERGVCDVRSRKYRMCEIAKGSLNWGFRVRLDALFDSITLWNVLPPSTRTVSFRSLVFRSLSRMGCAFQKLVVDEAAPFNVQKFRALADPSFLDQMDSLSKCLLGRNGCLLKARFGSFKNPDFLAHILAEANILLVDIGPLESRNASIRRQLVASSVQTWQEDLQDLNAAWVSQQTRTCQARRPDRHSRVQSAAKGGVGQVRKPRVRKKVYKSPGGAHRAFISLVVSGSGAHQFDSELHARYRREKAAKTELYLKACKLGRVATASKRGSRVDRKFSAFGPKRNKFAAVAAKAKRRLFLASGYATGGVDESLEICKGFGFNLDEALSCAQTSKREQSATNRKRLQAMDANVQAWCASDGKQRLDDVFALLPELGKFDLSAVPYAAGNAFVVYPPTKDEVGDLASWLFKNNAHTNLATSVQEFWSGLCRPVCANAARTTPKANEVEEDECAKGECLCSGSEHGETIKKMAARFIACVKRCFPPSTTTRSLLQNAYVVVHLHGCPERNANLENMLDDEHAFCDLWFHIGLQYMNPFEPSFMEVEPVPCLPSEPDEGRIYVKTKFACCGSACSVFKRLVKYPAIAAAFYRVEDADRRIGAEFASHTVPLVRLRGLSTLQVFYPRKQGVVVARARGGAVDGHPALCDGEVSDDEGPGSGEDGLGGPVGGDDDFEPPMDLLELLLEAYKDDAAPPEEDSVQVPPPMPPPAAPEPEPEAGVPLVPVDSAPPERGRGPRRAVADVEVKLDGGRLCYYSSNGNFVLECFKHDGCILTRRARRALDYVTVHDRPLGMMMAWFESGSKADCMTKADHWLPTQFMYSSGERLASRGRLSMLANAGDLLSKEKQPLVGHPLEV